MILTGVRIDAARACELGLVNRIAPKGQALRVARELANEIIPGSPTSVRLSLELMQQTQAIADTVEAVGTPSMSSRNS